MSVPKALASTYLYGAHVYRVPPLPRDRVFADMATMKAMGMNLVNIQESWSWENPSPGVFDFKETLALVKEAGRLGLFAAVTVSLDMLPKWVWDKYPDARLLNAWGEADADSTQYCMPADGKPGPCWDHPGVRKEAEKFLKAIARAMAPHPHMIYWNVWQEIGLWPTRPGDSKPQQTRPYNPQTLARFRDWLCAKHTSLDTLNLAWGTRFATWAQVDPPRMYFAVPAFTDFSKFIHEDYLTRAVAFRSDMLRKHDPLKRPTVFHTAAPFFGSTCEHLWSQTADAYGTSFYPTVQIGFDFGRQGLLTPAQYLPAEQWQGLYHMNYSRCATGPRRFMISELACGPYNYMLDNRGEVTRDDLRRWLLLQLASGSTGTVLWNTRPEMFWAEAQGQGFLDGDGNSTDRSQAAAEFGQAIARHGELLAQSAKPLSPVAIVLDEDLCRFAEGSDVTRMLVASLRGAYRCLFDAGHAPDFIDINRVAPADLSRRSVLVHPFPFAMSDATASKLSRFVEQGGTFLCGPAAARFSEYGHAHPRMMSPAVEALLGVRCTSLRHVAEFAATSRWTPSEHRPGDVLPKTTLTGIGLLNGIRPKAAFYLQSFDLHGAKPSLKAGDKVIGASHAVGKGMVHTIGTLWPYAILGEDCAQTQKMVERLVAAAVAPDRQGGIVRHRRVHADGRELWFFFNRKGTPGRWNPGRTPRPQLRDLLSDRPIPGAIQIDAWGMLAVVAQ